MKPKWEPWLSPKSNWFACGDMKSFPCETKEFAEELCEIFNNAEATEAKLKVVLEYFSRVHCVCTCVSDQHDPTGQWPRCPKYVYDEAMEKIK